MADNAALNYWWRRTLEAEEKLREVSKVYQDLSAKYDARPIEPSANAGGFPGVDPLDA